MADTVTLAPGMDGVILVAKPGVTRLAAFKRTLEQLQGVGANVLGVVLNEVGLLINRIATTCANRRP